MCVWDRFSGWPVLPPSPPPPPLLLLLSFVPPPAGPQTGNRCCPPLFLLSPFSLPPLLISLPHFFYRPFLLLFPSHYLFSLHFKIPTYFSRFLLYVVSHSFHSFPPFLLYCVLFFLFSSSFPSSNSFLSSSISPFSTFPQFFWSVW